MNIHKNARVTPLGRERIVRMAAAVRRAAAIAACVDTSPSNENAQMQMKLSRGAETMARMRAP